MSTSSESEAQQQDPHAGRILNEQYELLGLLAMGGMGTLYRARSLADDSPVVIKFSRWGAALQTLRQQDPQRAQQEEKGRVEREFLLLQKASSLSEHVVKVFEPLGDDKHLGLYYPMEFLDGTPLSETPEWGTPFDFEVALEIVLQVGQALAVAHGLGVVHRDLNPDNIFIVRQGEQERFVKLIDFGIARDLYQRRETFQTGDDLAFGHFNYMAPEQIGYDPRTESFGTETAALLDHRADIYSLGAILLHLFTGHSPFEDVTIEQLATRNWANPPNLRKALEEGTLPVGVSDLILSCLHPLPDGRPTDIYAFNAMLEGFLEDFRAGRLGEDEDEEDFLFDWGADADLLDGSEAFSAELQESAEDLDAPSHTSSYDSAEAVPFLGDDGLSSYTPETTAAYSTVSSVESLVTIDRKKMEEAVIEHQEIAPLLAAEAPPSEDALPTPPTDATMEVSQLMWDEMEFASDDDLQPPHTEDATMEVSQILLDELELSDDALPQPPPVKTRKAPPPPPPPAHMKTPVTLQATPQSTPEVETNRTAPTTPATTTIEKPASKGSAMLWIGLLLGLVLLGGAVLWWFLT